MLANNACSEYNQCMQYTVRNIPAYLDAALRRRAQQECKSLNEVTIEALVRGAGLTGDSPKRRDLRDVVGTWRKDAAFDLAIADQDTVDKDLWK